MRTDCWWRRFCFVGLWLCQEDGLVRGLVRGLDAGGGEKKDAGEGRCIARERTSARHRADTCACHGRDSPPSHNPTTTSPAGRPQESSTERHRSSLPTSKRSAAIRSSRLVHRMLSGSPALLHFAESGYSPPASAGEEKCARGLNDGDTFRRVRVCDVEIPPSSSCGGLARWRWPPSTQGPDRTSARTAQERGESHADMHRAVMLSRQRDEVRGGQRQRRDRGVVHRRTGLAEHSDGR
ncbi:hypothetical protein B2J93_6204 [Marssonina coronariae]|uniref:Uncharacterized protein n=1 Tax=Diplocarpon coronariae TaxID=2795749 RepID=A0A218ZJB4_9HELO|nr:hypothetical protein B2J93_6204 [Marssonina coronariae]